MLKYLYPAAWGLLAVLVGWIIFRYVKYSRLAQTEPERIKVRKDLRAKILNLICALIWIPLSCSYIYFAQEKIRDINAGTLDYQKRSESQTIEEFRGILREQPAMKKKMYTLLLAFWLVDGIIYVLELTAFRNQYITPKGIFFANEFAPAEKFSYEIRDDHLLLYKNRSESPSRHPLPEDSTQLMQMLKENYRPHGQNPS